MATIKNLNQNEKSKMEKLSPIVALRHCEKNKQSVVSLENR
ncbi:hypothetical protein [Helicobacter sp. T3_23-1056]